MSERYKHTVVLFSGGLDSTVLLAKLLRDKVKVTALFADYGQRHVLREKEAMHAIVERVMVDWHAISIPMGRKGALVATPLGVFGPQVPHGHYEAESMKATVVPNRNMVLIAHAASYALEVDADSVAYAAHGGDRAIYPDCRYPFVVGMASALAAATEEKVGLYAPFLRLTKRDLVRLGTDMKVPFELAWSCYEGGRIHCGRCGTCTERREAFEREEIKDPTEYAA